MLESFTTTIRRKRENHNDLRRTNRPSVIELQRHGDLDFLRDRLLTPRRSSLTLPRRAKIMVCHQTNVRSKIAIFSMVRGTVEEWIMKSKSGMETKVSNKGIYVYILPFRHDQLKIIIRNK